MHFTHKHIYVFRMIRRINGFATLNSTAQFAVVAVMRSGCCVAGKEFLQSSTSGC
jgi:hypothetical protein